MAETTIPAGSPMPSTVHGTGTTASPPAYVPAYPGVVSMIIVGAGGRGQVYASYALAHPDEARVVGVAEPRAHRRKVLSRAHHIPAENQWEDWKELVARGRVADAVVIGVLDALHAPLVTAFAAQGYHILCEKPMATTIDDCVKMVREVQAAGDIVFGIGHVLRYSPYNQAVKAVIDSGALGEIVNIQHMEPVGNQHFAHSFVRGNWKNEDATSFALMTKSCHDIDILNFYLSGLKPAKVSSFGSLHLFKPSKKPAAAGSAHRCLECAYEPSCAWSAKKVYVDALDQPKSEKWARTFVDKDVLDIESVLDELKTSPYGVCVYEAGNDVVDHQVVNIEYENGVTASMTMSAFSERICERITVIQGTKGELVGDMTTFTIFDFLTRTSTKHEPPVLPGGHGGSDTGFSQAFWSACHKNDQARLGVTPEDILDSHLLVFAAEQARLESRVIDYAEFKTLAVNGGEVRKRVKRVV
ncbi:hypothetical protein Q5752_006128 [Cryptotrichosporon argae]